MSSAERRPDILAVDERTGQAVIVEVKEKVDPRDREFFMSQLADYSRSFGWKNAFYVLVDEESARFFKELSGTFTQVASVPMDRLNQEYARGGARSEGYLAFVATAWLRDLAYRLKSEHPPGEEQLSPELRDLLRHARVTNP